MAFTCFKCFQRFHNLEILWKHLRNCHRITTKTNTKIICGQINCNKVYYSGYSYKRHLDADHSILNEAGPDVNRPHVPIPLLVEEELQDINRGEQLGGGEELDPVPIPSAEEKITEAAAGYIANLKCSSLPTSTVQRIIEGSRELIDTVVTSIEESILPIIEDVSHNVIPSGEKVEKVQSILNKVQEPFRGMCTEHQQTQYAIKKGFLVNPRRVALGDGNRDVLNRKTGRMEQIEVEESFQYVPLVENLRNFLQRPGCMSSIINNKHESNEAGLLHTYCDGLYYKERNQHKDDNISIELLLYSDEFETSNPLGPKKGKHKLLGVYMSVLCLPSKLQSRLENILLVALCTSPLVSKYGIDSVFKPVINDLENLHATGLHIKCGEFDGLVKPRLFQVVGDNLAMNTALGFAMSFTANYFCRFCKTHKRVSQSQVVEDSTSLRTKDNIDIDIGIQDLTQTGVSRSSILNQLSYYHVSENASFDIMHDFLEGLIPVELKLILEEFILYQDMFTLDTLNSRIQSFSYGFTDKSNKPNPILRSQLNHPFGASGQNAAQMNCLALYFPLLIGDKIPSDSEHWELFLCLLEIYKLVMSPKISTEGTYFLKAKIKEHHQLFLELFPEHNLIPKSHNITHYPRAIRQLGPLKQYICMRFEAKHKPLKQWARSSNNFRNIAKTLATKHQELQAYNDMGERNITCTIEIQSQMVCKVSALINDDEICNLLDCSPDTNIIICPTVVINGYCYRPNIMLLTDWDGELPSFVKVQQIVQMRSKLYLIVQPWKTCYLNVHYQAFVVEEDKTHPLQVIEPDNIMEHRPVHAVQNYETTDRKWYIVCRYDLA